MRTIRTGYLIVDRDTRELKGPRNGITYRTKQAAQRALDSWIDVDGYVRLFRIHMIPEPKGKEKDEHTGYFSRHR